MYSIELVSTSSKFFMNFFPQKSENKTTISKIQHLKWNLKTKIKKIDTKSCEYGDGGESLIFRPAWSVSSLKVSESCKENLRAGLQRLSAERHDMQSNDIVEDIIDPDLEPHHTEQNIIKNFKFVSRWKDEVDYEEDEWVLSFSIY